MSLHSRTASVLSSVLRYRHSLDISEVSHRDYDVFLFDEILYVDRAEVVGYLALSRSRILILYLRHFRLDYLYHSLFGGEYSSVFRYILLERAELGVELLDFEMGKSLQLHFKDRIRLLLRKLERFRQFVSGVGLVLGTLYDGDNFVDIGKGFDETQKDMLFLESFVEIVLGTPYDNALLMAYVGLKYLFEVEYLRSAVDEREHYHAVAYLHIRVFVEHIENDLRICILFDVDNDSHAVSVRLFLNVGYALYLFLLD